MNITFGCSSSGTHILNILCLIKFIANILEHVINRVTEKKEGIAGKNRSALEPLKFYRASWDYNIVLACMGSVKYAV